MSGLEGENQAALHDLNNIFSKLIGAAELALHQSQEPLVRAELETIVSLAEEAGRRVTALRPAAREP
jgi:hypothetical protein